MAQLRWSSTSSSRLWAAAFVFLLFAPKAAFAQDETENSQVSEGGECFPQCRTGYFCHRGECISLCNPLCESDETCTGGGECTPKEHTAPPMHVTIEPNPIQAIDESERELVEPPVSRESPDAGDKEPSEPMGIVGSLGGGASICASSSGCNTFERSDFGADVHILGGYRVLEWLAAEGGVTYTHLFVAKDEEKTDRVDFLLAARAGARFFPIGRRDFIEPVLGVHTGYILSYAKSGGSRDRAHGLNLDYVVGVDFKFTEVFSLGIEAAIYEPIWITTCSDRESQTDDQGNEVFEAESGCFNFEGKRDLFFFNFSTQATLFF
jgi:hypothetical protein